MIGLILSRPTRRLDPSSELRAQTFYRVLKVKVLRVTPSGLELEWQDPAGGVEQFVAPTMPNAVKVNGQPARLDQIREQAEAKVIIRVEPSGSPRLTITSIEQTSTTRPAGAELRGTDELIDTHSSGHHHNHQADTNTCTFQRHRPD